MPDEWQALARVTRIRGGGRRSTALALVGVLAGIGCGGGSPPPGDQAPPAAAGPSDANGAPQGSTLGTPTLDAATLPGSILFISERDGNLEVYRWRAGVELERLTDDPRSDFPAEVAADGSGWTRVVTEDGAVAEAHVEQIVWMPREGAPVDVGPPGRRARAASWAPDRRFVVFESDAEQAFSDVWRWEPGGALRRLTTTEHGAFEPAVSPDGRRIAFVSTRDGNPEIYVMEADGSTPRRLTEWRRDDITPLWSPDGTRLAFLRREQGGERLFVLAPAAGEGPPSERRLVPTAEGEKLKHADAAWSPDGTRLAYTVHRPGQPPHVAVTDVADGRTQVASPPGLRATMPAWSPDGRHLALTGTEGDPEALDLYAVRLHDGAWARLTDDPAPDWLPRWTAP
jgi:TolB protein